MLEITSNSVTVWVNTEQGCVARYCPRSAEIKTDSAGLCFVPHNWASWKGLVRLRYDIDVTDVYRPAWDKPGYKNTAVYSFRQESVRLPKALYLLKQINRCRLNGQSTKDLEEQLKVLERR